ncbi:hypothetical protein BJQ90_03859 [Arthrobacter sp. SO3]|nr:hypothetical protein [Arthrobacter sp. SO3]
MSVGMIRLLPHVEYYVLFNFVETEKRRTCHAGVRRLGEAEAFGGEDQGVDSVHTSGCGLGRTRAGLARTRHVSAGVPCLQGLESGSSPTSGTVFSLFRGF